MTHSLKRNKAFFTALVTTLLVTCFPAVGLAQETTKTQADKDLSSYQLSVKYAETRMQLAEIELQHALALAKENPGMVPYLRFERLRSGLAIAKQQYDEVVAASHGGNERVQLRHAQERIRLARIDLENGQKMGKQGVLQPLEIERLELKYELAQLRLQILKNPQNFTTLLHYVETRVDQLAEEILALDQRISKLEPTRGIFPKNP